MFKDIYRWTIDAKLKWLAHHISTILDTSDVNVPEFKNECMEIHAAFFDDEELTALVVVNTPEFKEKLRSVKASILLELEEQKARHT